MLLQRSAPERSERASPRLRTRLLTLVAIPLLPAFLLVLLLVIHQSVRNREEAQASAFRIAQSLAVTVASHLREIEGSLAVLAVSTSLQQRDLAAFRTQALAFQQTTALGAVVLLDATGRQVVNTSRPFGAELPNLGPAAPALAVIASGKPMARVVKAALTGQPIAVVSVPVRLGGELPYALSTVIDFQRFDTLLRQQRLPASWIGAIVDPSGIVVARTSESERFVGVPASQSLRDALATSRAGTFDGVTLDGIPVRTLFTSAGVHGWSVAVGVPKAELMRELQASMLWLSMAAFAVFSVAAGAAWWYATRIGRAMGRLNEAAGLLGRGEPVAPQALGIHEADELAGAMARASADLRSANAVLARNEARWSAVLESAMDGIVSVDSDLRIVIYNPAAERIFGWSAQEALGQPLDMLVPPAQRERHGALVRQFGRTRDTSRRMGAGTVNGLRKGGEVFPVEASISHLDTGEGELYTVIVRDVTERVQARDEMARMAAEASRVREEEKGRIARELHDELAQSLAILKMDLQRFARQVGTDRPEWPDRLRRMMDIVDSSVVATRRIAADLRPLVLDDLGLPAAIEWLASGFTSRTGVPCRIRLEGDMELPEPYATGLFRILQESLANVAKHANARRVELTARRSATEVVVAVQDDGAGFDTASARKPLSLGLAGLRERVQLLHGSLVVTSRPGEGTRVEVRVPYEAAAATAAIA